MTPREQKEEIGKVFEKYRQLKEAGAPQQTIDKLLALYFHKVSVLLDMI